MKLCCTCTYLYLLMMDVRSRALLVVHICETFVQTVLEAVHGRSFHDRLR